MRSMIQEVSLCEKVRYRRSPELCLALKKKTESKEYGLPHDLPVGIIVAVGGNMF